MKKQKVNFKNDFSINGKLYIENKGTINIGKNFSANSGKNFNPIGGDCILRLITFNTKAILTIGDNVGISNSSIICWDQINIGNNVVIGGGTKIWDTNFHSLNPTLRISGKDNNIKTDPITIKDNAFIGGLCIILKGVTIGTNSIVAAGSVVTKDVPDNAIAGGNPCKVIKRL